MRKFPDAPDDPAVAVLNQDPRLLQDLRDPRRPQDLPLPQRMSAGKFQTVAVGRRAFRLSQVTQYLTTLLATDPNLNS